MHIIKNPYVHDQYDISKSLTPPTLFNTLCNKVDGLYNHFTKIKEHEIIDQKRLVKASILENVLDYFVTKHLSESTKTDNEKNQLRNEYSQEIKNLYGGKPSDEIRKFSGILYNDLQEFYNFFHEQPTKQRKLDKESLLNTSLGKDKESITAEVLADIITVLSFRFESYRIRDRNKRGNFRLIEQK